MTPPHAPACARPDEEPILMTRQEWDQAKDRALAELGMTYEELAEEARRRDFRSARARRLWVIIGDSRP